MNSALVGLKNYSADLGGCYPPWPSPQGITPSSMCLISLACVSSETHNLQPVFRPREGEGGGGSPLYRLYRYVRRQRVCFFSRFGLK